MAEGNGGSGGMTILGVVLGAILVVVLGLWLFGGFGGGDKPAATFNIQPPASEPASPPTTP
jgi:hypothetical protein